MQKPCFLLIEPPEEGDTMCLPFFSLKCHNGAAKATFPTIVCPPPMKVVKHREVPVAVHDCQVRPLWGVLVDGCFWVCWVPLE